MRLLYVLLLAAIVPLVSSAAPTGITHYANVTITYNGLAAFPSSFQQMITANVLNYTSVMTYNGNSANFELYYANDTVIPAWIESNSSNTLTIWANVVGGFYAPTSSATSTNTLYLGFASKTTMDLLQEYGKQLNIHIPVLASITKANNEFLAQLERMKAEQANAARPKPSLGARLGAWLKRGR